MDQMVLCIVSGIGSNSFVYQGVGKLVYIRCFYFSFKTAAGIGKNSKPTHEWEYIFMATLWLEGHPLRRGIQALGFMWTRSIPTDKHSLTLNLNRRASITGSFIFAFILGQIKDIVATAVRGKAEYQESMDLVVR